MNNQRDFTLAAAPQPPAAAPVHLSDTESDYGSVTSAGIQGAGQEDWRDLLIRQGVSIALVTFTRPGANSKEMSVVKGDYLEVLNMDRKWWKVRNRNQEVSRQTTSLLILPMNAYTPVHRLDMFPTPS